jgi:hypothetical protein
LSDRLPGTLPQYSTSACSQTVLLDGIIKRLI